MGIASTIKHFIPPQHQSHQPGDEEKMIPKPKDFMEDYKAAGKLTGKVAIVTGGDSGIGRAVSIAYAKEGADVAIVYLEEENDATITSQRIEKEGRRCLKIKGDIGSKTFCENVIKQTVETFGKLNILVNNAGEQHIQKELEDITEEQLKRTFATNIFGPFFLTQAALEHLEEGDSIINTASIVAYKGIPEIIDYSATKGAILSFTRALSTNLAKKGIRVNAVAPGPIWTPLIPSSFGAAKVAVFGKDTPMGRAGQPDEVAPAFVYLASDDSTYVTGQTIHVNGGTVVNG